jgi:glycerol uptake facilitator-like aquaporin
MRGHTMRRLPTLLGILLVLGCGSTDSRPDLTGTWRGGFVVEPEPPLEPFVVVLWWTLTDSDPDVTGTVVLGFDVVSVVSVFGDVTGSHRAPDVTLTMTFEGATPDGRVVPTFEGETQGADNIIGVYTDVLGPHSLTMVRR